MRDWKIGQLAVFALCVPVMACGGGGDEGATCGPGTVLRDGVCVPDGTGGGPDAGPRPDAAPAVPAGALRVFVTETDYERDLGGLDGANSLCLAAASAAGLSGPFVAWLSGNGLNAIDRLAGNGPWYDMADRLVFSNRANLATSPRVSINHDEFGDAFTLGTTSTPRVWTGTAAGGEQDNVCSGNWFGLGSSGFVTAGSLNSDDGGWTDSEALDCIAGGTRAHLYCFEVGVATATP